MLIRFLLWLVLGLAFLMTWRRQRQGAVRTHEALAWSVVWIAAAVVVAKPDATTLVAQFLGVGRGADLMLYAAVITLLILVFQLHVAHHKLERQLTEMVRKQALEGWQGAKSIENRVSSIENGKREGEPIGSGRILDA